MFLWEWSECPSSPCVAKKKKTWWQLASRCCSNRARPWHASELVSVLVGLRTYQHSRTSESITLLNSLNEVNYVPVCIVVYSSVRIPVLLTWRRNISLCHNVVHALKLASFYTLADSLERGIEPSYSVQFEDFYRMAAGPLAAEKRLLSVGLNIVHVRNNDGSALISGPPVKYLFASLIFSMWRNFACDVRLFHVLRIRRQTNYKCSSKQDRMSVSIVVRNANIS